MARIWRAIDPRICVAWTSRGRRVTVAFYRALRVGQAIGPPDTIDTFRNIRLVRAAATNRPID